MGVLSLEGRIVHIQLQLPKPTDQLSEVETDNIRRYDDSKMDQHGNPISTYSAVIEWRHGKKQRGGWPHYRATVICVSGKLMLLWFKVKIVLST